MNMFIIWCCITIAAFTNMSQTSAVHDIRADYAEKMNCEWHHTYMGGADGECVPHDEELAE